MPEGATEEEMAINSIRFSGFFKEISESTSNLVGTARILDEKNVAITHHMKTLQNRLFIGDNFRSPVQGFQSALATGKHSDVFPH